MTAMAASLPRVIRRKLVGLRARLYLWLVLRGLGRCVLTLAAAVIVSLLLDWTFRLDHAQRVVILAVALVILAAALVRWLVAPLARRVSDEQLCLSVEAAYPHLRQRLVAAVELARAGQSPSAASAQLCAAVIAQGADAAGHVHFGRALDRRFTARARAAALSAVLAALALAGAFLAPVSAVTMRLWLHRNVLLADTPWPQRTHLLVRGLDQGRLTLPRGDDWLLIVDVQGQVPRSVILECRGPDAQVQEIVQEMTLSQPRVFQAGLRNMLEPLRFRVRGGDDVSAWFDLQLVERPAVSALELRVQPPAYTGLSASELPPGQASHHLLAGSALHLVVHPTKALAAAHVQGPDQPPLALAPREGAAGPAAFAGTIPADQLVSGVWSLVLHDRQGLESRPPQRLSLRVEADRVPTVRARFEGVGSMVTARASVPIHAGVSDDFALTAASLGFRAAALGQDTPRTGERPIPELEQQLPTAQANAMFRLELEEMHVEPGVNLSLFVQAADNDTVSGPKVGRSTDLFLRVVSDQDLRAELLRREQEQRLEFECLIKDQEDLEAESRALLATPADGGSPGTAQQQSLARLDKAQRQVGQRCGTIAGQFEMLLSETLNNRLDAQDSLAVRRLSESIIAPLRRLESGPLSEADEYLAAARRAPQDAALRDPALLEAAARQRQAADAMRQALRHMEKWAGYQEAVNLLHEVLRAQDQVGRSTREELRKRLERIFD